MKMLYFPHEILVFQQGNFSLHNRANLEGSEKNNESDFSKVVVMNAHIKLSKNFNRKKLVHIAHTKVTHREARASSKYEDRERHGVAKRLCLTARRAPAAAAAAAAAVIIIMI